MQQTSMRLALVALVAALATAKASLLRKTNAVPKKDMKVKNPLEHASAGDLVPNVEAPDPKGQNYNHMYAPISPPHAQEISPSDPVENIDSWQGHVAEWLDHMSATEMRIFEGSTCESVCAACEIYAAQMDEGMCECYSTCKLGECGRGSGAMPHIGWSNNVVSTPRTEWDAKCNIGEKNCAAECMKKDLKKSIKDCKKDPGNPIECFRKLKQLNQPLPMDSRKQVHYCARKGMETCDTFMNVPTDNGWMCYSNPAKCEEKIETGFRLPMAGWEAPSVWKSVEKVHR